MFFTTHGEFHVLITFVLHMQTSTFLDLLKSKRKNIFQVSRGLNIDNCETYV